MLPEQLRRIGVVATLLVVAACASSSVRTETTFEEAGFDNPGFRNILVIGVAGSYETRAQFERMMASKLNASGVTGTAYYAVVGRNAAITRSEVTDSVRARGFDSVILTRVVSQHSEVSEHSGASTAKATRRDAHGPVDLFRYDYEVLNNPSTLTVDSTVVLSTEVFSAADEKRIYEVQTTISDKEDIRLIVDESVDSIIAHLRKDGIVGR